MMGGCSNLILWQAGWRPGFDKNDAAGFRE